MKLRARTVAQVHREAEGSLLATQGLLAQGALALPATTTGKCVLPSARKVLVEFEDGRRIVVAVEEILTRLP